jgi:hypothetical protein
MKQAAEIHNQEKRGSINSHEADPVIRISRK